MAVECRMVSMTTQGAMYWSKKEVVGMLVGEQIQLPFGCHRKDMGRCGIRTNLEVTISPKQRLCLVRISFFGIECDNLGWSIIWRDLCGWASRKPTKFCTLLFLCFFSVLFRVNFLEVFLFYLRWRSPTLMQSWTTSILSAIPWKMSWTSTPK